MVCGSRGSLATPTPRPAPSGPWFVECVCVFDFVCLSVSVCVCECLWGRKLPKRGLSLSPSLPWFVLLPFEAFNCAKPFEAARQRVATFCLLFLTLSSCPTFAFAFGPSIHFRCQLLEKLPQFIVCATLLQLTDQHSASVPGGGRRGRGRGS